MDAMPCRSASPSGNTALTMQPTIHRMVTLAGKDAACSIVSRSWWLFGS